jgi:tetratricopeptide (TPR) repeat protein
MTKRLFLIGCFLTFSICSLAQSDSEIPALKKKLLKPKSSIEETVSIYLALSQKYNRLQPDSAYKYIELTKKLIQKTLNQKLIAKTYNTEANYLQNRSDFEGSMAASEKAIIIYEKLKDTLGLAQAYNTLGLNYKINGGDNRKVKDFLRIGLQYEQKALGYYLLANDIEGLLRVYSNIGIIYRDLKELEKARVSYLKGIALGNENKNESYSIGILKANLSQIYREVDQNYDGAIALLHEAISIYQKNNIKNSQEHAYRNISYNYSAKNEFVTAIIFAKKATQIANEVKNTHRQINAYSALYTAQKGAGLYKEAFENYDFVRNLEDSLFSIEKTSIIAQMNSKFETQKKIDEIKILNKDAELNKLQRLFLIFGILILSATGALVYWNINRKRKEERLLQAEKLKNNELELELKQKEITTKVLQLARKNEFLNRIETEVENLKTNVDGSLNKTSTKISKLIHRDHTDEKQWEQFSAEFAILHASFLESLVANYGSFSKSEIRLISLLKMNISSKDIANILNISPDGLKKARYRLRKKLLLPSDEDIQAFLISHS